HAIAGEKKAVVYETDAYYKDAKYKAVNMLPSTPIELMDKTANKKVKVQILANAIAHELGHLLGRKHPGDFYYDPSDPADKLILAEKPWLPYSVDPYSLMGWGTGMRGYYFNAWKQFLNNSEMYSKFGPWYIDVDQTHKSYKETKAKYDAFYTGPR